MSSTMASSSADKGEVLSRVGGGGGGTMTGNGVLAALLGWDMSLTTGMYGLGCV